jgi:2-keto-4-pentenoate hydratase/2-oxohepta-3-ene-1,7-dioic acid hydratase in catechol pathway
MRICRYRFEGRVQAGLYHERRIVPFEAGALAYAHATGDQLDLHGGDNLLEYLPPSGPRLPAARKLATWLGKVAAAPPGTRRGEAGPLDGVAIETSAVELLVPVPRPNKLFLLAGNYAEHIEEGGGVAAERAETFPYVFMKPPSTTLTDPGKPVRIPAASPGAIDWELELAVVIGRQAKGVSESEALDAVAGYTVVNDISNRRFRPNPSRKQREKDAFFDWLHGKWHDSFCPCGPCILAADPELDPQKLELTLRLNGEVRQHSSTARQIFPVAAVIEFISAIVTLEPGDIISTGTPSGVGSSTGTFLKPGDVLEAEIASIGSLVSPVVG